MIKIISFALIFFLAIVIVDASAQVITYHLTVRSTPNIIFLGGAGDYEEGSVIKIDSAPATWQDYTFVGWKIDGIWSVQNPPTIRMDKSHTVEAIYDKTYTVDGIIIDAIPRIVEIVVDGDIYLPDELPLSFNWETGSKHVINIPASVGKDPTTRYVFDSWKDQNSKILRTITAGEEDDYIALFKTQHFLKSISDHGTVLGGGWQDSGSSINFKIESDVVLDPKDDNIQYTFRSWDKGDYPNSAENTIDFVNPTTIRASWDTEYMLSLQTNVPDYDIAGGGWNTVGKNIYLIAEEEVKSPNSNINYVFEKWVSKGPNPVVIPNSHSASTTITLEDPYLIEAQYKKSYKINVWTPFSSGVGGGFHEDGTVVEIRVQKTEVIVEPKQIRKIFTGWNTGNARTMDLGTAAELDPTGKLIGGENLLIFADKPLNVTAKWKTQYFLDAKSPVGMITGAGWYDIGKLARVSVQGPSGPENFWTTNVFDRWIGDHEGDSTHETVIMNKPKTMIAEWKQDSTPGIYNSLILAGVAIGGIVVFSKTRHRISFHKNVKELIDESKPFEKFFTLRKPKSDSENNPSFYKKPKKKKALKDWLLGKN